MRIMDMLLLYAKTTTLNAKNVLAEHTVVFLCVLWLILIILLMYTMIKDKDYD